MRFMIIARIDTYNDSQRSLEKCVSKDTQRKIFGSKKRAVGLSFTMIADPSYAVSDYSSTSVVEMAELIDD